MRTGTPDKMEELNMPLKLTFLGTNGWYSTEVGSTVCALIETPDRYIVLDAGEGMHKLDEYATDQNKPVDVFLSHFHLDHIIGLHIQPKFNFRNEMRIFGQTGTKEILGKFVNHPFTAPISMLKTKISVHDLKEGKNTIEPPTGVKGKPYNVVCAPLVHSDTCWGFRFELIDEEGKAKILSYCTDTGPCENIVALSDAADAIITESGLLPGEMISPSWPHLNPETAAKMANEAGCKKLILTHFAAHKYVTHGKRFEAQQAARVIFENTFAAIDGMEIEI